MILLSIIKTGVYGNFNIVGENPANRESMFLGHSNVTYHGRTQGCQSPPPFLYRILPCSTSLPRA